MKTTKTIIAVKKMDCPSEEAMIRERLSGLIHSLECDLRNRTVTVYHDTDAASLVALINELSLDAHPVSSEAAEIEEAVTGKEELHRETLRTLLVINAAMFAVEAIAGLLFDSMGLLGDGLDMLADASVYSLALFAVGRTQGAKNRITLYSGIVQLALALGLGAEVTRKFIYGSAPLSAAMISVSAVALAANAYSLYLITPHRHGEKYMTASWIFSANDVIVNIGVILAGVLVFLTKSNLPDLLIGSLLAVVVIVGALRILRLARASRPA